MSKTYYTYMLIDPRSSIPFYVGKGMKRRMYQHKLDAIARFNPEKLLHWRIMEIVNAGFDMQYQKVLINVSETDALNMERELIKHLGRVDLHTGPLLNETSGGPGASDLTEAQIENKRQRSSKPVSQYTLDGDFITNFPSAKVASEKTGANRSYITQCCKERRKSAGGYLWTYEGYPVPSFSKKYHRAVAQCNSIGNVLATFRSLTAAQNQTGIELHNISECCRGKSKTAGGFVWKYVA